MDRRFPLAITVNKQEGLDLQEVIDLLQKETRITRLCGSREIGETGQEHLQLVADSTVQAKSIGNLLKQAFPELTGLRGYKGQRYSCAPCRTGFSRHAGYCLKAAEVYEYILKGVTTDQADLFRDQYVMTAPTEDKGFLGQLTGYCRTVDQSPRTVGRRIIDWHIQNGKTVPNKWRLADYIRTVLAVVEGRDITEVLLDEAAQLV